MRQWRSSSSYVCRLQLHRVSPVQTAEPGGRALVSACVRCIPVSTQSESWKQGVQISDIDLLLQRGYQSSQTFPRIVLPAGEHYESQFPSYPLMLEIPRRCRIYSKIWMANKSKHFLPGAGIPNRST